MSNRFFIALQKIFVGENLTELTSREQRQLRFIISFSFIGATVIFFLGVKNFRSGQFSTLGLVEVFTAILAYLNVYIVRKRQSLGFSSTFTILLLMVLFHVLFVKGTSLELGLGWFLFFPLIAFFLKDVSSGLIWSIVFIINNAILLILSQFDLISISASIPLIAEIFIAYIAITAIILIYEFIYEESEKIVSEQQVELKNLNSELKKEFDLKVKHEKIIEEKNDSLREKQKLYINALDDVREQKKVIFQQKEEIDTILHSIGDGVFSIDMDGNITMFNDAACKLTGWCEEEPKGKFYRDFVKFVDPQGNPAYDFIDEAMNTRKVVSMPKGTKLINRAGERIPVGDSCAPVMGEKGEIVGCVVVFRDITLEYEVDKAKTEFVSLASHQLRTPLSVMRWYLELLSSGELGELKNEQLDAVKEVESSNIRMINLIGALLNVSRIELGTFQIDPVMSDIREFVDIALKEQEPQIVSKKLHVSKTYNQEIPETMWDSNLIGMVIQNLISNAVKYTPDNGNISVEVSLINIKKEIRFLVKDDGYGIPEEQKSKIFEKLFRADNILKLDVSGTGLGLYIVKSIVDESGGRIEFESEENKGSTFSVIYPISGMHSKKGSKKLETN